MELLILNKGEESERSGRRFPIRKPMLSYKEYDNAQAVEIVLAGRVSTKEFDQIAEKLKAFIKRHGQIRSACSK